MPTDVKNKKPVNDSVEKENRFIINHNRTINEGFKPDKDNGENKDGNKNK